MPAFASCRLLPACRGLADKVRQEGNLGCIFLPTCHDLVRFCCQVMQWMYYLPRKWLKSCQVGSVKCRILSTCHGLVCKVCQVGNLGYHFLSTWHSFAEFHCQVMQWMYYLPRKWLKSCQVGSVKHHILLPAVGWQIKRVRWAIWGRQSWVSFPGHWQSASGGQKEVFVWPKAIWRGRCNLYTRCNL